MDDYALESHRRAAEATDSGHFAKEAIPVPIRDDEGTLTGQMLDTDEGIRATRTMERLASLAPGPVVGTRHRPRHHGRATPRR